MKKLFTLMGLFALSFSFGQEIFLLDDYLKASTPGSQIVMGGSAAQDPAKLRLKSLLFDLNSNITVTATQELQHSYADANPVVLKTDGSNLDKLADLSSNTAAVEAMVITVRDKADFQKKLPAKAFGNMPGLKYVFFDAGVEASLENIQGMIQGEYPGIVFLYRVSPRD